MFQGLGRHIVIGHLAARVCDAALLKTGRAVAVIGRRLKSAAAMQPFADSAETDDPPQPEMQALQSRPMPATPCAPAPDNLKNRILNDATMLWRRSVAASFCP